MQEIYKRLHREGAKIILGHMNATYFGGFYTEGYRDILLSIREIDTSKVILYGFPEEHYEMSGIWEDKYTLRQRTLVKPS